MTFKRRDRAIVTSRPIATPANDVTAKPPENRKPALRAHVLAAYQSSHKKFGALYEKLAE